LWSAKAVLEVTAKTDKGNIIPVGMKEYFEIGYDLSGNQRMGSWEIKEILDFSLQPLKATEERFLQELLEGTKSAEIEIKVALWPSPTKELVIHQSVRKVIFE
jgi:hypothetical protein